MKSSQFIWPILAVAAFALVVVLPARADNWKKDKVWRDGMAEKAVYSATRIVYGKPRSYEMIVFTNKESHDRKTLTKAEKSNNTLEVWKHNHIEEIPTPNYRYHYQTTSHLTLESLELTRLESSSQEFCGTSFKQFQRSAAGQWDYWSFSYFPEAGRKQGTIRQGELRLIAFDALPLALRDFDFGAGKSWRFAMLPSQKSNRPVSAETQAVEIRSAGREQGSHKLELMLDDKVIGTFWMAADRLHVMTRYRGADGQGYDLMELSRVNYWTIE
jgi:hypothetical protein